MRCVWLTFFKEGDQVKVFLLASGVEYESLNSEKFNIIELAKKLLDKGGEILACGTCLNLRKQDSTGVCPLSNMNDHIANKIVIKQLHFNVSCKNYDGVVAIALLIALLLWLEKLDNKRN